MSCDHLDYMEDEKEGTIVCIKCGLVLDQLYLHSSYNSCFYNNSYEVQAIQDICANFHIPKTIEQKCIEVYENVHSTVKKQFPKAVIVAFCVYHALMEHDVPRSPQEILCMTGIELPRIFDVEKEITNYCRSDTTSVTYVERFGFHCGLSFNDIQCIKNYCLLADSICENYAPQTIAAALISYYCKLHKKNITVQKVAKTCLVSASSMYRITQKLTKEEFMK